MPPTLRALLPWLSAALVAAAPPALAEGPGRFCGGAATPGDPSDLANVVGDQTLEYTAELPASLVTCARGYLLEKCGDHESAHKVFDKCIAAGYVGAMIWKALLLEDGTGTPRDSVRAAELMRRAATSDDPHYAPLGKLHYATALYLGRGVAKNEAEAMTWFRAAAEEGNEEAREFLRSGYHTGSRDQSGLGAGRPTAAALAGPPRGENTSLPQAPALRMNLAGEQAPGAPQLRSSKAPVSPPPAEFSPAAGQRLIPQQPMPLPAGPAASWGIALLIAAAFVAGIMRQRFLPRGPALDLSPRP